MPDGFLVPKFGHQRPSSDEPLVPDRFAAADMALTKRIAAVVDHHYPGHPWLIVSDHKQGIVKIKIPQFMGATNWGVIWISTLKSDPGMRSIIRICGEILERYRIPRVGFSRDDFLTALSGIPKHRRFHGVVPH